jgi:hypothetical protein
MEHRVMWFLGMMWLGGFLMGLGVGLLRRTRLEPAGEERGGER